MNELTLIVQALSAAAIVVSLVVGGIKVTSFVSERPTREEVSTMIDTKLEAVNAMLKRMEDDIAYIRKWIDDTKKRK